MLLGYKEGSSANAMQRYPSALMWKEKSFINKWQIFLIDNTKQNSARTNAATVDGFEKSVLLRSLRFKVRPCCRVVSGFGHLRIC
jgi:hypothetical protein